MRKKQEVKNRKERNIKNHCARKEWMSQRERERKRKRVKERSKAFFIERVPN